MTYVLTFAASFAFIFLKAFQQRNVTFDNYRWVVPTSILMASTEVFVIANIAHKGWQPFLVLMIGLGSGLGAIAAMFAHRRIFRVRK